VPLRAVDAESVVPSLRNSEEIQGNVLAAFNKDRQAFLLMTLPESPHSARAWLREICPAVVASTTRVVEDFNADFSEARRRARGHDPGHLTAAWVNVGFTFAGMKQLLVGQADGDVLLEDLNGWAGHGNTFEAFRDGPCARAAALGDVGESDPSGWRFGGPGQPEVSAVLTVAADRAVDLREQVDRLLEISERRGAVAGDRIDGATLPGRLRGHEHFGYKDGISQPGVRGFHPANAEGDERDGYPGARLIAAGEFVLGHVDEHERDPSAVPGWLRNASFQVFRLLRQDVPGWFAQARRMAQDMRGLLPPATLGAKLIGRWPSGTPLVDAPWRDDHSWTGDLDNGFDFADDPDGHTTPRFAHIRKAWPRNRRHDDDRHRIMRRGIPYGPPADPAIPGAASAERGLVFNAYCADFVDQFEYLQGQWLNDPAFPSSGDGSDPVCGTGAEVRLQLKASEDRLLPLSRFVHTRGTLYAIALSTSTLSALGDGQLKRSTYGG
jgi:Dyp-type peroxidase family